jgi:hypothetical protein
MGTAKGPTDLPLWYAAYDGHPSFANFGSFGGWTHPSMKQFAGQNSSRTQSHRQSKRLLPDLWLLLIATLCFSFGFIGDASMCGQHTHKAARCNKREMHVMSQGTLACMLIRRWFLCALLCMFLPDTNLNLGAGVDLNWY